MMSCLSRCWKGLCVTDREGSVYMIVKVGLYFM